MINVITLKTSLSGPDAKWSFDYG